MPENVTPISLPFDEAIEYFRQKLNMPSATWTDLWQAEHARAFTVAGAMQEAMLDDFREAIDRALEDGTTYDDFLKAFDDIVTRYGWSYNGGRGWRSRVIYGTNVRTAYQSGRYKQMTDPDVLSYRPFWRYRHGDSAEPRPEHLAWDGLILPADDPWWDSHYPPNGWGCSCYVEPLSMRDMEKLGKTGPDQRPDAKTFEWVDKKTGEIHDVPFGIDPGWAYNPGKAWLNPQTNRLEEI